MTTGQKISVVVVDDHAVVREGLVKMLSDHDGIEVEGVAATGAEGLSLVEVIGPDVLLLDLQLADVDGLDVLSRVVEVYPRSRVVVLTIHDEPETISKALRRGASGYVLKDAEEAELVTAIRAVASGKDYFQPGLVRSVLRERVAASSELQLSPRELQVLLLLADGLSNRQVGETLFLSRETVKSHVATIFRKLEVSDRAEAVAQALRSGLID